MSTTGRYIENIAKGRASDALASLMSLQPRETILLKFSEQDGNEGEQEVVDEELIDTDLLHLGM